MSEGGVGKQRPSIGDALQRFHNHFVVRRIDRATGQEIHPHDWKAYQKAKKLEEEGKAKPLLGENPKKRVLRLIEDATEENSPQD